MPLQSRAAQGFAGAAVKIDLTLKVADLGVTFHELHGGENRPDSQRD